MSAFQLARPAGLLAAASLAFTRLAAQPVQVDPTFAPQLLNDVPAVSALACAPLADGSLLVRGDFTHIGGASAAGLARLRVDGTLDPTFATFARAPDLLAPLPDGRIIIVTNSSGYLSAQPSRLERLLADGSPDTTYAPVDIPGLYVAQLIAQPDGRILVAGSFSSLGALPRKNLARLLTDGTPDPTFDAGTRLDWLFTAVTGLIAQPDGKVVVCASAYPAPGYRLTRVNADGSADATFSTNASLNELAYRALAVQPDGKILATTGAQLLRFNADGSADATFVPAIPGFRSASQLIALTSGQIIVEAAVSPATPPTSSTLFPHSVFLLGGSGAVLRDFRTTLPADSSVDLLAVHPDSRLILRFGFPILSNSYPVPVTVPPIELLPVVSSASTRSALTTSSTDESPRLAVATGSNVPLAQPALARVDLDGTRDASFAPTFTRRSPATVEKLATDAAGRLLAVGTFTSVNGSPRPGLARFFGDGSLDPAFQPAPQPRESTALAFASPDGQVILRETVLGPKNADGVFSLVTAHERLLADGSRDAAFKNAALPVLVLFHAVDAAGHLFASGFDPDASAETNLKIFRLAADGSPAATLTTRFSGLQTSSPTVATDPTVVTITVTTSPTTTAYSFTNPIAELQPLADGGFLVHAYVTTINGASVPGFARLNADGSTDSTYRPVVDLPNQYSIAIIRLLPGGRLLYAQHEEHDYPNPIDLPATSVLLRADGTRDPAFDPPPGRVIYGDLELSDGKFLSANGYLRWLPDGFPDPDYRLTYDPVDFSSGYSTTAVEASGHLYLGGNFRSVNGQPRTGLLRLVPAAKPGFTAQPQNQTLTAGRDAVFQAALGTSTPATYQWTFNGVALVGATDPALVLRSVTAAQAGTYRLLATTAGQTFTSDAATLTVTPNTARLVNFSHRSRVSVDGPPQLAGFVLRDRTPHPVLLRAIGLGLATFNLPPASLLPHPLLRVQQNSRALAENAGGATAPSIAAIAQRVGAFPAPSAYYPAPPPLYVFGLPTHDSALSLSLPAGVYTAQTLSADGQPGLNLFEFYDASASSAPSTVANLSLRARSAPGDSTLLAGFVISGTGPLRLLLRAIGPELTRLGVSGALADPQLTLRRNYAILAQNDNWSDQPAAAAIAATAQQVGAFALPAGSRDAALLVTLEPGVYTAQVDGIAATSGEAMLELYVIDAN